jgi:hypothetical protein
MQHLPRQLRVSQIVTARLLRVDSCRFVRGQLITTLRRSSHDNVLLCCLCGYPHSTNSATTSATVVLDHLCQPTKLRVALLNVLIASKSLRLSSWMGSLCPHLPEQQCADLSSNRSSKMHLTSDRTSDRHAGSRDKQAWRTDAAEAICVAWST